MWIKHWFSRYFSVNCSTEMEAQTRPFGAVDLSPICCLASLNLAFRGGWPVNRDPPNEQKTSPLRPASCRPNAGNASQKLNPWAALPVARHLQTPELMNEHPTPTGADGKQATWNAARTSLPLHPRSSWAAFRVSASRLSHEARPGGAYHKRTY